MDRKQFSVATFNLFNLQDAGKAMYGHAVWTEDQFRNKAWWIAWQLETLEPDIVGLQELWSKTALEKVWPAVARNSGSGTTCSPSLPPATP